MKHKIDIYTRITAVILLLACATIGPIGCSTTKDAQGNTTTTTTATGDAAIAAAIQIASVAATAAIQTYLTSGAVGPHGRLQAPNTRTPAIVAAMNATEEAIGESVPSLSKAKRHSIVVHQFALKAASSNGSP